jgi:hypothetical protein
VKGTLMIALAVLVAGCGSKGKDAAVCRREAAELATLLRSTDHEMGVYVDSEHFVVRDLPAVLLPYGPMVRITADAVLVEDEAPPITTSWSRGSTRCTTGTTTAATPPDPGPPAIDDSAPWSVWSGRAAVHDAGFTRAAFGFRRRRRRRCRRRAAGSTTILDALMASSEAAGKATELRP